jgi:hypothetical protein
MGGLKLSRAPPCFGMHVKPLLPATFTVVSTHQTALSPRGGLWPVLLSDIHKEGLNPSSWHNGLMMMMIQRSNP